MPGPNDPDYVTLLPGIFGADWLLQYLLYPLVTDVTIAQLSVTVPAGGSTIFTVNTANGKVRIPFEENFGNVFGDVFTLKAVWDDVKGPIGPFTLTQDIIGNGLTPRLTKFVGPVRNRVQYTFTNVSGVSQLLEFNSWGINIPIDVAQKLMSLLSRNLSKLGISVPSSQYPDFIGGY